jgi:flagellar hook-associated protein 2
MGDFGLEFDKNGALKFDKSKFEEAYKENPDITKEFFKSSDIESGFFEKLDKAVYTIGTKSTGTMKSLKKNFEEEAKRLADELAKAQERLNSKYEILAKQFADYDRIMGQLSSQQSALDSIINPPGSKDK